MAHARSWRALVVEDERFARLELLELLRQHPQVEVVGEAGDLPSAVASAERLHPGVVFLDIHLGGVSGFDLLPSLESGCRVIFVTAYDAYAVRAFEVNAVD